MNETILVYGNEPMLMVTLGLILEEAGHRVFAATTFANALLALVNRRINVLLLDQSLTEVERRSILRTARAIKPDVKIVVFGFDGREDELTGGVTFERLDGPDTTCETISRIVQ
jgi:DNA-binding response OmpR family regulator